VLSGYASSCVSFIPCFGIVTPLFSVTPIMYDGFSDTGIHYVDWVQITKEFLKFAFADDRCEASCPCSRCENRRMLSKYEMSAHLANLC
jgi:hypothetical protein